MKKLVAVVALLVATPFATYALDIPGAYDAIFDGQTEVTERANKDIHVDTFVSVDAGEALYAVSTDVIGDGMPRECHKVAPIQGAQTKTFQFDHQLPPNTGDYDFEVRGYVADNVSQAKALQSVGDGCVGTSQVMYNEGDVVHVIPDGSGSSSSNDDSDEVAELTALVASLTAQIADLTAKLSGTGGGSPTPTTCEVRDRFSYVGFGSQGNDVTALQSWLITHGFSIPAIQFDGASYGYYGSQTATAYNQAVAQCNK